MTGQPRMPPGNAHRLVVATSYGPTGASARVRVFDWLQFLGLRAEVHDYLSASNVRPATLIRRPAAVVRAELALRRLTRDGSGIDRLLISRSMGPFTRGRVEAALLRRAAWGVYDFDDALWADRRGGVHRIYNEQVVWERAVRNADLVIAGNDRLAEAAARLNPEVEVIPSCLDPSSYAVKQDYTLGPVPKLVWIGSPANEWYLDPVAPALLEVNRLTGARLMLISAGARPLGRLAEMTDRVTWDAATYDQILATADVGIMPVPDDPYTRGKCAYKLLQYGAASLPVVASPVGVNAEVLQHLAGLPATDTDSWVSALLEILTSGDADRRARGAAARRAVEERYSFAVWRSAFLRALRLPDGPSDGAAAPPDRQAREGSLRLGPDGGRPRGAGTPISHAAALPDRPRQGRDS
jgi:glycosyltransferase involved in cell wall biosynthesis